MTQQEAKALSIEVWQYLADHPEGSREQHKVSYEQYLPKFLYDKIKDFAFQNPLCEVHNRKSAYAPCKGCPMLDSGNWCGYGKGEENLYHRWRYLPPYQVELRQQAADFTRFRNALVEALTDNDILKIYVGCKNMYELLTDADSVAIMGLASRIKNYQCV